MGLFDIFKKGTEENTLANSTESAGIITNSEALLAEVQINIDSIDTVKLPIEQLGMLGAGVASMMPSLRTIQQNITIKDNKLFRWVNGENAAGTLKLNKKDNLLSGAFIDNNGKSVLAKFQHAGGQSASVSTVMPIDPLTLMMAAALMSIEHKLDTIIETQKEILSFLEKDKEAEIEGDLKALTNIIKEYKFNWDNTEYKTNHHKLALDIKRTSEKNIIFYQKQISEAIKDSSIIHIQNAVDNKQSKLQKLFRYYRMSLYIYSFASYVEVMLLGNFQSEYVLQVKSQVEEYCNTYKKFHSDCYAILEKSTAGSIDKHILKGVGVAAEAVGNFIGSIPKIKDGQADEWLVDKGADIKKKSENVGEETLANFKEIEESGSMMFAENLELVDRLYNRTSNIYIDKDNVYLAAE